MSLNITNLFYSEKDIGATIKLTKRQFIWEFEINGNSQRIELLDSRFSGKKRLFKNGVNLLTTTEKGNFIHNFDIDGYACVIIQYGDKIELRINNQSFTHLYNLQKNKQMFAGEKGPTSNTYVAKSFSGFGSSEDNSNNNNDEGGIYKISKPEEEKKQKLFNFEIKKDGGKKPHEFNAKFKFGSNKGNNSSLSKNYTFNNNNSSNNNNINNNNNPFDFGNDNNSNNNNNSSNNNPFDFGNDNNSNVNNQNNNNNQNQQKSANDIFDLFGNNNNNNYNNQNIQNNNNNQSNNNNDNLYNNIFLAISDGSNQQPVFDQNNLDFMNLNNNNMNNNVNNNVNNNMNNNFNNFQNQQMNQGFNQNNNNNGNNQQQNNNLNMDLLNF